MFSASRIIAVDDERKYLEQLAKALHSMGIPCIPLCYPDDVPQEAEWFRGVRILFCDLHLLPGAAKPELNYSAIGALLERMTSPHGSPLLLILWTAYAEDAEKLRKYLAERHADAQPIEVFALKKSDFDGGKGDLPSVIREKLEAIPQLRALYEWQDDVAEASNACVGTLLKLAKHGNGDLKGSLDELLTALAQAATSTDLAANEPGAALQEVLVPLLADRLSHLPNDQGRHKRWAQAMPSALEKKNCLTNAESSRKAAINTGLHIASPGAATGRDRGAVIQIDCAGLFLHRFAQTKDDILSEFKIRAGTNHRWLAVQVEAACDYAQQKSNSVPFVLALEVPAGTTVGNKSPAIWCSPFFISEKKEEVMLVAIVRYATTISWRKAGSIKAIYRLREPLVNELAFRKSHNDMRPGIVRL